MCRELVLFYLGTLSRSQQATLSPSSNPEVRNRYNIVIFTIFLIFLISVVHRIQIKYTYNVKALEVINLAP